MMYAFVFFAGAFIGFIIAGLFSMAKEYESYEEGYEAGVRDCKENYKIYDSDID